MLLTPCYLIPTRAKQCILRLSALLDSLTIAIIGKQTQRCGDMLDCLLNFWRHRGRIEYRQLDNPFLWIPHSREQPDPIGMRDVELPSIGVGAYCRHASYEWHTPFLVRQWQRHAQRHAASQAKREFHVAADRLRRSLCLDLAQISVGNAEQEIDETVVTG